MKKRNAGIMLSFIVATLLLVVGYAAVTNINLSVNGSASASANNENFNVEMVAGSLDTTGTTDTVSVTDDTTTVDKQLSVDFIATGFTAKGDKAVITYEIENTSNDLEATLSSSGVTVTVPADTADTTYYANGADLFDTDYYFDGDEQTKTITVGSTDGSNTTTVTVVLTLNKTIVDEENVLVNVSLPITATAN